MKTRVLAELDWHNHPEHGMPRDRWLALRRQGIGSSDVAAILGLDRFRSPMAVYLDKLGERVDDPETDLMRFGRKLETVVASEVAEQEGGDCVRPQAVYQHPTADFAIANIDRFRVSGWQPLAPIDDHVVEVVEIKTGRNVDIWEDGPPAGYVLQTLHQMEVVSVPRGRIAVLLNGHEYRSYEVERDELLAEMLLEREAEFWVRVVERVPPPADGHEATTEALKRMYARVTPGETVELSADYEAVIARYRETRDRLRIVREAHDEAANQLRAALRDAEIGTINGQVVVTWKKSTGGKGRVNLERLEADHPDLVARYREPADTRRLLVK